MTRSKTPPTVANAFRNKDYETELDRVKRSVVAAGGAGTPGPQGPQGPAGAAGAAGATGATGPGVAVGGTAGQVLAKKTATDYDTEWVAQTGGGGGGSVAIEAWKTIGADGGATAFAGVFSALAGYVPQYRKRPDGIVELRGMVKPSSNVTSGIIFTLPVGYRPDVLAAEWYLPTTGHTGAAYTDIDAIAFTNGNVSLARAASAITSTGWISLYGLKFPTDQATFPTGPAGPTGPTGATGGNATVAMDTWHVIGAVGEPAFTNGWVNDGAGSPAKFRKDPLGKVIVEGRIKGGNLNTSAFTLPAGYRPAQLQIHPAAYGGSSTNVAAEIRIGDTTTGTVTPSLTGTNTPPGNYFSIECTFDTETVTQMPTGPQGPAGPVGGNATVPMDIVHIVGTAGEPAFQNSFAQQTTYPVGFRKNPFGRVALSGVVSTPAGAAGTAVAFTLPVGYRPVKDRTFWVSTASATNTVMAWVNTDGTVNVPRNVTFAYLDEIDFDTETVTAMPTGPQGPAGPGVRGLVTVLPTLPQDGDECYFQTAAMAAAGVAPWHLRYRAAISDAYKWEVLAAQPLRSNYSGSLDSSITSYADIPGTGIAVPVGGYYTHQAAAYCYCNTAGGAGVANVKYGSTGESGSHEMVVGTQIAMTITGQAYAPLLVTTGLSIIGRWKTSAGISRLYYFNLAVTPTRVG